MKIKYIIMLASVVILASSCEKTVDVKIPKGVFAAATVFASENSAQSAMNGLYETMTTSGFGQRTNPFTGVFVQVLGLTSDELARPSYDINQQQFFDNIIAPENPVTYAIWSSFYFYIYQANQLYHGLEQSTTLSQASKDELMGEAMFIRGICLWYLAMTYNKVPIPLSPDYTINGLLPNLSQNEVYNQAITDLKFAIGKMSATKFMTAGSRVRANKWTATAFLAKLYLQKKDWENAEINASLVIANTSYKLEALDNVFLHDSNEAIWQLANPGTNLYNNEASPISGSGTTNSFYRLTPYIVSLFNSNDQRRVKWTRNGTGTGLGTVAPFKFKTFSNTTAGAKKELSTPLRLAELYLLRAEARANQDKLSDAIKDLDEIRKRAGAVADNNTENGNDLNTFKTIAFSNPTILKGDLLDIIYEERARELFAENGHRWFDAKRSGKALSVFFGGRKTGIKETDAYFPIPFNEMHVNPNLTPNDGY